MKRNVRRFKRFREENGTSEEGVRNWREINIAYVGRPITVAETRRKYCLSSRVYVSDTVIIEIIDVVTTETVFHPVGGVCTAITITNNVVARNRARAHGNGGRTIFNEHPRVYRFRPQTLGAPPWKITRPESIVSPYPILWLDIFPKKKNYLNIYERARATGGPGGKNEYAVAPSGPWPKAKICPPLITVSTPGKVSNRKATRQV